MKITLHPGQTAAWDSVARYTFAIAGHQSGKTSFEPLWLDREIRNCGPGDYLAVTSTYDVFKLKFLPEMIKYFVNVFGWSYAKADRVIYKGSGDDETRIILRSASAPGGLESSTIKAAVIDECGQDEFSLETWEAIQRRLSLSQGRVFGGTTPYNLGWLKTEVFDRWRKGDPDYRVIQFKSTMNPLFPMKEYYRMKARMQPWKFAMFYDGEFSRPAGLIYGDFTDWHKVPAFEIPTYWPVFICVDFGAVHTAKLFIVQDPQTNVYYVVDDRVEGDMTSREHVATVKANDYYQAGATGFGGSASEKQFRADWKDAGLFLKEPTIKEVESGIDKVTELIKTKRLRVFEKCAGLIDEIGRYARKLGPDGEPTDEIKDKQTFHRLDALRYFAVGILNGIVEEEEGESLTAGHRG
jgi:hypothetical protein